MKNISDLGERKAIQLIANILSKGEVAVGIGGPQTRSGRTFSSGSTPTMKEEEDYKPDEEKACPESEKDELEKQRVPEGTFAGYKDFADCVKQNQDKNNPDAYCAVIGRQVLGDK